MQKVIAIQKAMLGNPIKIHGVSMPISSMKMTIQSHCQSIEALSRDLRSLRNIFDYQHDSDKVKLLSDYNDAKEYCSKLKEKMKLEL